MRASDFNGLNLMVSLSNHGQHRFGAEHSIVAEGRRRTAKKSAALQLL